MKNFPIRKKKTRSRLVMPEVRPHFPKPKIPLRVFWDVHNVERIYMGWDDQ